MISRRQFFNRTAGAVWPRKRWPRYEVEGQSARHAHRQPGISAPARIKSGDFAGLLQDMKEIGIGQVELDSPDYTDSAPLADGKQTRRILDDHGMKCPSIHFTMKELRANQQKQLRLGAGRRQAGEHVDAQRQIGRRHHDARCH